VNGGSVNNVLHTDDHNQHKQIIIIIEGVYNGVNSKQVNELNSCWNDAIRRMFGHQRSESVNLEAIRRLGRVNVKCQILLHKVKYYKNGI